MSGTITPERETGDQTPRPWYRKPWVIVAAVVAILVVAAGVGTWWYLRDDAPEAVDLEAAARSLDSTSDASATTEAQPATTAAGSATTAATASTAATTAAGGSASTTVAGTWNVDTSVGEFSFEDSTGTFVGFRVEEELSGIGATTAVGRTPVVAGSITFDGTSLTAATIEADMTKITTNDRRRDDRVQDALATGQFPTATFTLTSPIDLGEAVNTGAATSVQATGDLTIHGVTTPVTMPLEAQVVGDTVVVVGSLDIALSTYGVEAPRAPVVVSVSDQATIELQLFFRQA